MGYKHLSYEQRCMIYALIKSGYNQSQIAKEIGVHRSIISRELKRNITKLGAWPYKPDYAQTYAEERIKYKAKRVKMTSALKNKITSMIKQEWSPEQISGYAKKHKLFNISHETIYQFILADKQKGGSLYFSLRHQHKRYRKRYGSPKRNHGIKDRIMIDENTNGLVRQYIKKGSDIRHIDDEFLSLVATKLNNRPRKSLCYSTPMLNFHWNTA